MTFYQILLNTHSILRQFVLLALVILLVISLVKWIAKKPFVKFDDRLSLYLMIFTHLQLVTGLVLYFISPNVQFSGAAMKNDVVRYWTAEHIVIMIIAVALITVGRIKMKRYPAGVEKFKTLFIYNSIAVILIIAGIAMSGRSWI